MKSIKRKPKAFENDKLDNTAPVKKILDDLYRKNYNGHRLYNRCLARREKALNYDHVSLVGHQINQFRADWDGQLNFDFFQQFPYKSTFPEIITPARHLQKYDPLSGHIKKKSEWKNELFLYSKNSELYVNKYEQLNEEVAYCPMHIVNTAALVNDDPDPNFDCGYNWYYTGHGNLQIVTLNCFDYLIHCELNYLYVTEYSKNELKLKSDPVLAFDCGTNVNILETIIMNDTIVVLRTMYLIFILKITIPDQDVYLERLKEIPSTVAYISISCDSYHKNILYITKLDNSLTIVNIDRMTKRSVQLKKPEKLVNNWSCVVPVDRLHYCHVTSNGVALYDKRTNNAVAQNYTLSSYTDIYCNKITSARMIKDCLYLTTDHNILTFDVRYCKKFKPKPIQRWTHNMQSPPTYMSNSCYETDKELICASSQWCEDLCLFVSESTTMIDGRECSGAIPLYRPHSIKTTLKEAREKWLCSELDFPLESRISTAITGVLLLEVDDKYTILMQNALGDIISQSIYPSYMDIFIENNGLEKLDEWNKKIINSIEPKPFEVSNVINIAEFLNSMKIVDDTSHLEGDTEDHSTFSMEELNTLFESGEVDSTLLDAWNVELSESKVK